MLQFALAGEFLRQIIEFKTQEIHPAVHLTISWVLRMSYSFRNRTLGYYTTIELDIRCTYLQRTHRDCLTPTWDVL